MTLSIAIMSGKGGVGKTNLALNLAYAFHAKGFSTMLMDCDMGLANLDVLLGVAPERNLEDLLDPEITPNQVIISLEDQGLDFLPAASGVPELVEWDDDIQTALLKKLNLLFTEYDYLLLDLGAGINSTVVSLAAMTRIKILVISSEPTSLTDGYALIKILSSQKQVKNFFIVVNMVKTQEEGEQAFKRLKAACEKFLGLSINLLGIILYDPAVQEAVIKQTPLSKYAKNSKSYENIQTLSSKIASLQKGKRNKDVQPLILNVN